MKRKIIVFGGAATLALLMAFSAPHIGREPAPVPDVRHMAAYTQADRASSPTRLKPDFVGKKTADLGVATTTPTKIDFALPKPSDSPAISAPKEAPRDKPSPASTPSQTTATITATEPKMRDTRIMDGQQQVYFLGFGWIDDSDEPNVGIVVGGDTQGADPGDINKMVGTMG